MDNKKQQQQNFTRPSNSKLNQSADSSSSQRKSTDLQSSKPWPRNSRRREQSATPQQQQQRSSNNNSSSKQQSQRPNNYDKRPRPRGGGIAPSYNGAASAPDDLADAGTGLVPQQWKHELNSVYAPGSKKQNLNHLLNFHYAPRESSAADYNAGMSVFGRGGGMQRSGKKHKYNKEQFMQANFQFVIKSSAKPKLTASPDTLIDWNLIEQINIQTTEEPQCPICLYPPIAAKLTRCGHAYCWPCILHYLALSDKSWRKCPICYEAIHTADLKSTVILQQLPLNVDADITFRLMRREKGSMFIEHFKSAAQPTMTHYPQVACIGVGNVAAENEEAKLYSKFLIAKRGDILDIIERERRELIADEDSTCPEFVFVNQALDLLRERLEKLGAMIDLKRDEHEVDKNHEQEPLELPEEIKIDLQQEEPTPIGAMANIPVEEIVASCNFAEQPLMQQPTATNSTSKFYYFYQSVDGQNIYLHPLNVKMLQMCYDSLEHAPHMISARILQKEHHSMDEDHRRKFKCLGHLPLTCQFAVVEVDLLPPTVTDDILRLFKNDLIFRKKERQRREREERKREKHINEINDRQMGKLIASTANINLSSSHEFPTCGFEDVLLSTETNSQQANSADVFHASNHHSSYSEIAVGVAPSGIFPELSTWGRANNKATTSRALATSERSGEYECASMCTNLSDVLAEAFSQKKQNNTASQQGTNGNAVGGNKKNKKAKKMLPLFSTGMNFNGN